ncbi:hypothetical protein [Sneathiella glossodoripedis]|uniref:hypothetical protein n=1 Tax=Sneathiella glossodoripedis TaxID=418853 RepID=UPI00046FC282|nr:hypothetical protein [Sneathiella glossodoripedis]
MTELIQELKIRARLRHKSLLAGDHHVFRRLRKRFPHEQEFRLKHSLHLVAYESGFADWPMALRYLQGRSNNPADAGSFWYSTACMTILNHWFADYEEASAFLEDNAMHFLVPYKRQFVVVDRNYMLLIGCNGCETAGRGVNLVTDYGSPLWQQFAAQRIGLT